MTAVSSLLKDPEIREALCNEGFTIELIRSVAIAESSLASASGLSAASATSIAGRLRLPVRVVERVRAFLLRMGVVVFLEPDHLGGPLRRQLQLPRGFS
ncbi:hypothetical protein [Leifsonia aquatica]|uniref:hypothetical protein n=1 Tax=Leifsonia aquatica TaxID=144185 RepID=UPI003818900F